MVNCDENRERLRMLQFADVEKAIDEIYAVVVYDTIWRKSSSKPKKPSYIKTDARWRAMVSSVMRNNTRYDNDIDEPCLKI